MKDKLDIDCIKKAFNLTKKLTLGEFKRNGRHPAIEAYKNFPYKDIVESARELRFINEVCNSYKDLLCDCGKVKKHFLRTSYRRCKRCSSVRAILKRKITYANYTEEQKEHLHNVRSRIAIDSWNSFSEQKKRKIIAKQRATFANWSDAKRKAHADHVREAQLSRPDWYKEQRVNKAIATKMKNGSINYSKQEDICYKKLRKKFGKTLRQYKEKRYPFFCDFYIPSLDLFIECNFHWTHGNEPFNEKKKRHRKELKKLKDSAKSKKYYAIKLYVWTERDVLKRKTAKKNRLNFLEFFNINEFNNFINGDLQ